MYSRALVKASAAKGLARVISATAEQQQMWHWKE